MDKQKLSLGIFGVVGVITLVLIGALVTKQNQVSPGTTTPGQNELAPTSPPLPTKTAEEIKIISQIETKVVTIKNFKFDPETLTVKLHDQVVWKNQDTVNHQIKGNNWGNVPIGPGENFTQAFDKAGTFPYVCALHPTMTGTIIVK
ncbi:hypothetical protein COT65_01720 [Candidatus Shapirobacteria bacterium CG09_land_8_20_14_0_10_47_13]|uniref:EfeO-type cupredoxin-like domain-containing protein n=1 Tax=Candidatus Shapirobacteria bacterium CG09_land_8_20_14_0_10_47_13 TaxID=1974481 RepID=A0A2H0WML2_9BACT|nr:MAG: hypothetical protein COT65_01720 [Candidatus Shapirobacteria bacterium CG09_land_8_20_14_0_10_47_13]